MAVDAPTVNEILTRFPSLEANAELVEMVLPEAIAQVDTRWRKEDQKIAIQYLVAHMVTVEVDAGGGVDGGTGSGVVVGQGPIASESFGSGLSVSYGNGGSGGAGTEGLSASEAALASTVYGRRFADLRRKNFPRVVVGEISVAGCYPYPYPY